MMATTFVDNAKVMSKGQITIPKDIRDLLGLSCGDRVTFIVDGNTVRMVNAASYAMQILQSNMSGAAAETGIGSEEDVMAIISEMRNERPILRAAQNAKVDVLLTGDKDFLESGVVNPKILDPASFIECC